MYLSVHTEGQHEDCEESFSEDCLYNPQEPTAMFSIGTYLPEKGTELVGVRNSITPQPAIFVIISI